MACLALPVADRLGSHRVSGSACWQGVLLPLEDDDQLAGSLGRLAGLRTGSGGAVLGKAPKYARALAAKLCAVPNELATPARHLQSSEGVKGTAAADPTRSAEALPTTAGCAVYTRGSAPIAQHATGPGPYFSSAPSSSTNASTSRPAPATGVKWFDREAKAGCVAPEGDSRPPPRSDRLAKSYSVKDRYEHLQHRHCTGHRVAHVVFLLRG